MSDLNLTDLISQTSATDIGTYKIYCRLKNSNDTWWDNSTNIKEFEWSIIPSNGEVCIDGIYYILDSATHTAKVGNNMGSRCSVTSLDIPGELIFDNNKYIVNGYTPNGFYRNKTIQTIHRTGANITDLTQAFVSMDALTNVKNGAFNGAVFNMTQTFLLCEKLKTIAEFPKTVTILACTFMWCDVFAKSPPIPSSAIDMQGTYYGCKSMIGPLTVPNTVKDARSLFYGCQSLRPLPSLPSNATRDQWTYAYTNPGDWYWKDRGWYEQTCGIRL